jgi:hypothetical protein
LFIAALGNVGYHCSCDCCSMDENLQQSDAWRELVIPHDNGCMYFLKAGVCAKPFPQCAYCIYEKGNGRMCLISRLLFFLVMYFGVGGDMFNPNLD